MPLNNYPIDVVGITIEADPSALKLAQNLADLPDSATARSNLGLGNYLQLAGGTMTGAVHVTQINNTLNTDLVIDSYNDTGAGTHYLHKFTPYDGKFNLATNGGGLVFPDGSVQTVAGYPNTNPNNYVSSAGISQNQAYAISLVSLVNSITYMGTYSGSIAYETPYLSANKVAMFKFLINNAYDFTPTWSGTNWSMSSTSDDTFYTTTGSETITIKWNSENSVIPVRS